MAFITLLTDFGLRDGYPGVMKGVIWRIAPDAQIADITHSIPPQNIRLGALALARTAPFFPPGTIHVAVVDPGVGTDRLPMGLACGNHFFIGPDNGLFTLVMDQAARTGEPIQAFHLDQPRYWLPSISRVFHGRDIFAPVAAHLANGVPLEQMGSPLPNPVRLAVPHPYPLFGGGYRGEVVEVDTFGNLSTNLEDSLFSNWNTVTVSLAGRQIEGLVSTFGDRPVGSLVALVGTHHDLVISIVNGDASRALGISLGAMVEITPAASGDERR